MLDFEIVFRDNNQFVFRFLMKLCGDVSLAEELIKEYCKQTQCVTILITHSLEQAKRMSAEIIEIDYGKIINREVLE